MKTKLIALICILLLSGCCKPKVEVIDINENKWYKLDEYPNHILIPSKDILELFE